MKSPLLVDPFFGRVNTCCETIGSRFPHILEPAAAAASIAATGTPAKS